MGVDVVDVAVSKTCQGLSDRQQYGIGRRMWDEDKENMGSKLCRGGQGYKQGIFYSKKQPNLPKYSRAALLAKFGKENTEAKTEKQKAKQKVTTWLNKCPEDVCLQQEAGDKNLSEDEGLQQEAGDGQFEVVQHGDALRTDVKQDGQDGRVAADTRVKRILDAGFMVSPSKSPRLSVIFSTPTKEIK